MESLPQELILRILRESECPSLNSTLRALHYQQWYDKPLTLRELDEAKGNTFILFDFNYHYDQATNLFSPAFELWSRHPKLKTYYNSFRLATATNSSTNSMELLDDENYTLTLTTNLDVVTHYKAYSKRTSLTTINPEYARERAVHDIDCFLKSEIFFTDLNLWCIGQCYALNLEYQSPLLESDGVKITSEELLKIKDSNSQMIKSIAYGLTLL